MPITSLGHSFKCFSAIGFAFLRQPTSNSEDWRHRLQPFISNQLILRRSSFHSCRCSGGAVQEPLMLVSYPDLLKWLKHVETITPRMAKEEQKIGGRTFQVGKMVQISPGHKCTLAKVCCARWLSYRNDPKSASQGVQKDFFQRREFTFVLQGATRISFRAGCTECSPSVLASQRLSGHLLQVPVFQGHGGLPKLGKSFRIFFDFHNRRKQEREIHGSKIWRSGSFVEALALWRSNTCFGRSGRSTRQKCWSASRFVWRSGRCFHMHHRSTTWSQRT